MPKSVTKKSAAKSRSAAKARPSAAPATEKPFSTSPIPAAPQPAPASGGGWKGRVAIAVLVVVALAYYSHRSAAPNAPGAAPAAGPPALQPIPAEWGSELKLEKVSSLDAPDGVMDFYVGAKGDVYTVTGDTLSWYSAGKLSATAGIGSAPNRSLASDGKSLYVTDSDNATVARFTMGLAAAGGFQIKGASRLLGLAWSASSSLLEVCDVDGQNLYGVTVDGQLKEKRKLPKGYVAGFVYDVTETNGRVAVTDIYNGCIYLLSTTGKAVETLERLGPSPHNRRMALVNGNLYVPCDVQGVLLVVDMQGKIKGYVQEKYAPFARSGHDGFLYALSDGEIKKFKPL